jgi:hypothetical protein
VPYASSEQLINAIHDLEQEIACLLGEQAHPALVDALEHRIGTLRLQLHGGNGAHA